MLARHRSLALPVAALLGACFPPPLQPCIDDECTGPMGSTSTDAVVPTTGAAVDDVQTVTGEPEGSSTSGSSSGSTTGEEAELKPAILEVEVDPNPIKENGWIKIDVATEHADGVRMKLKGGDVIELGSLGAGSFQGHIPAFTGLDNGRHSAALVPSRDANDGRPVDAPYTIALPEPGSHGLWETGDLVGEGNVAALDVLLDGSLVELGTFYEDGEPRCYLRRRDHDGGWFLEDFVSLLPGVYCTAIDMKIDREVGTLRVLLNRKGGDGLRWWLGEIASWEKGMKQIGLGAIGDMAEALAHRPGLVAVCGARQVPTLDLDAAVWLHWPDQPVETVLFDYWPMEISADPHQFDEAVRDCVFSGETLALVGEAFGKHAEMANLKRERLLLLEYDPVKKATVWTVAGPGPGTQSRAHAVAIDDDGRYLLAGYTCDDSCEPDGDVRIYLPGGELAWQASLGPLGSDSAGPNDIAWSPAGYMVIALADVEGQEFRFKVQAIAPHVYKPLWTFLPLDMQGLQVALALTVGPFGEVYAGGIGADKYPAVAYIPG